MKKSLLSCIFLVTLLCAAAGLCACSSPSPSPATSVVRVEASQLPSSSSSSSAGSASGASASASSAAASAGSSSAASSASDPGSSASGDSVADALYRELDIDKDFRKSFVHGEKPAKYQKYIVLHDTEGDGDPEDVVEYWADEDDGVAAHFVVGTDGHIVQCVPLDKIAHHAGFGDTGHNKEFGVKDESRDDKEGTEPIGDWAEDYGMNSYSIGIEMVHVGGEGGYPKKQLKAVDKLIAYIDAYYGKESKIIDHKAWRTGNSDTSEEFEEYLENYQDHRSYK